MGKEAVVDWSAELGPGRELVARTATADRVADVLRSKIVEGLLAPGTRLSEEAIGRVLGVSRNTLREALRMLCHERLAVHELNRGVFVRVLSVDDVVDIYRLRRLIESAAVRDAGQRPANALDAVRAAVGDGERAAARKRWREVGTVDLRFHQALAGLLGSSRIDELMRGLLTELRLVFHVMPSPHHFHQAYLPRNREICELLDAGDIEAAENVLTVYLDDAERELVNAYRRCGADPQSIGDAREALSR